MTLIDRYVFREWLKVFAMGLLSMVGLLVVVQMFTTIKNFQEWGTSAGDIASFYFWQIPEQLPIVLPVTLLVTLLFTLGTMHKNQEIAAMRAAGLSLWRITRAFWFVGIACTLALLAVNTKVIPYSLERTRSMRETEEFQYREKKAAAGKTISSDALPRGEASYVVFDNGRDNRRWRIGSLGAYANRAYGIQVYELDDAGKPLRQIYAKQGRFDTAKGCWVLENGRELEYAGDKGDTASRAAFVSKAFPALTEKPMFMMLMSKKPGNLSFDEIGTLLSISGDLETAKTAALEVRYHSILAWPFSCLVVVAMAIPFAVAGVRTNPMVGVSKSIGVFALYYLCDRVGFALGSQQVVPAMLAAWLPNLAALAYAIPLCAKAN